MKAIIPWDSLGRNVWITPTENILYFTIVYYAKMNIVYHSDTTVNYSEVGQFTVFVTCEYIVLYSRTMVFF